MSPGARTPIDIPEGGLDTPYGRLYRPAPLHTQIVCLVLAFCGGPAVGWLVGAGLGDLSESAHTVLQLPYALVFFVGYSAWLARLQSIAFDSLGRALLKALFIMIVRRRKPESLEEVLPTRDKLLQMLVRAQHAGGSFGPVSLPIALMAGALSLLFDSATGGAARFALVAGSCAAWGFVLAALGRRGYLPFAEE